MNRHSRGADRPGTDSIRVTADEPALMSLVAATASELQVPAPALRLQSLLHLPRIADPTGWIAADAAKAETLRVAALVPRNQEWMSPNRPTLEGLRFGLVNEAEAQPILEHFHYLRSFRENSQHYGLYDDDSYRPVALASTSVNDVKIFVQIAEENGLTPDRSKVVSRVFAFHNAPHNAISMLLGQVGRFERQAGTRFLLTYVNPNVGFTGVSDRASNWTMAGEDPTAYDYVDGIYVTARYLKRRYGTSIPSQLRASLGSRYERSRMPLLPLQIFAIRLH
jgi:hypothetical protein